MFECTSYEMCVHLGYTKVKHMNQNLTKGIHGRKPALYDAGIRTENIQANIT